MITIAVIDNQPITRKGLTELVKEHFNDARLIEAGNFNSFQELQFSGKPDLFILGINEIAQQESRQTLREVKKQYPKALMIVYDVETQPDLAVLYLKSGVNGYLSKQGDLSELIDCIETVLNGKRYFGPGLMDVLFGYLLGTSKMPKSHTSLTVRQYEIAQYLSQGMKTSYIAEKLGLHLSTISTVKATIFHKLGVDNILKLKEAID